MNPTKRARSDDSENHILLSDTTEHFLKEIAKHMPTTAMRIRRDLERPILQWHENFMSCNFEPCYIWIVGREIFKYHRFATSATDKGFRVVYYPPGQSGDDWGIYSTFYQADEVKDHLTRIFWARDLLSGVFDNEEEREWHIKILDADDEKWEDNDEW